MALFDNINPNLAPNAATQNELFSTAFSWEPKRQHHFILQVNDIPSYLVKASGKPTITNGEVALDMINIKRYVKGKSDWSTITMTLYDAIVPSGAQAVMEWYDYIMNQQQVEMDIHHSIKNKYSYINFLH